MAVDTQDLGHVENVHDGARTDRRSVAKARHRTAILAAARDLIAEHGGPAFSVDELADRADVSRRTVFNHFATVDDILVTLCTELLAVVVDDLIGQIGGDHEAAIDPVYLFGTFEKAMRSSALARAINAIITILGGPATAPAAAARTDALKQIAFNRIARESVEKISRRSAATDPLDVEIMFGAVMAGVVVIADRWVAATGGAVDSPSLALWDRMVGDLFDRLGSGFRAD